MILKLKKLVEFQQTITRRRKHQVGDKAKELPIRFYVFDVLEKDGLGLITQPLLERKEILAKLFDKNEVLFETSYIVTQDQAELHQFHEDQLNLGLEGAVMKRADGNYTSGRKGWNWVKIKEAEGTHGKLSDTLDVVVMGYYSGRGKRASFGMGAILVGVWDEKTQEIKTVTKIGTGLTEQKIVDLKKIFDQNKVDLQPKNYKVAKNLYPDVWLAPEIVIEVAADEITNSPIHTSGKALRFPRFVKVRNDKNFEEATTVKELGQITHLR
jgi:DNA ligase-1